MLERGEKYMIVTKLNSIHTNHYTVQYMIYTSTNYSLCRLHADSLNS
jgi:hypothetical protein